MSSAGHTPAPRRPGYSVENVEISLWLVLALGLVSYDSAGEAEGCLDGTHPTTYTTRCPASRGREGLPPVAGVLAAITRVKAEPKHQVENHRVRGASVLRRWGSLIDRYRGFIPRGVVAIRIYTETGGNPTAGPVGAGRETGLLQLWLCRPPSCRPDCGYTEAEAKDPELNLKCMLPMWRRTIGRVEVRAREFNPGLFRQRGGYEYWACMQLSTMIGEGAFDVLLRAAQARPGLEYTDIRRYVEDVGEGLEALRGGSGCRSRFGCQSAAVVARRVVAAERMTLGAAQLGSLGGGGGWVLVGVVGLGLWWAHKKGWI